MKNYEPWNWREAGESLGEALCAGLLMFTLFCGLIILMAAAFAP